MRRFSAAPKIRKHHRHHRKGRHRRRISFALKNSTKAEGAHRQVRRPDAIPMLPGRREGHQESHARGSRGCIGWRSGDRAHAGRRYNRSAGRIRLLRERRPISRNSRKRRTTNGTRQSVYGTVKSVDPAANEIVDRGSLASHAAKEVTLDASGSVCLSVSASLRESTEPSSVAGLTPIQTGDQVRLIGQKNADQTEIKLGSNPVGDASNRCP